MSNDKKNLGAVSRRSLIKGLGAASVLPMVSACGTMTGRGSADARVVVIGGGFGGATAAKYLKRGNPNLDVTLVEPAEVFYTCPFSNLYLGGIREMNEIAHNYDELKDVYGVQVIHQLAQDVDPVAHTVTLGDGTTLIYDKLVMSPGIDFRWNEIEGYDQAAPQYAPHAWQAGEQTRLLRRQLEGMDDGGVFVLVAPDNPFRCPPGPYERASMVAHYFSQHKPNSKVLILDAKDNFSKQGLFTAGWNEFYGNRIEWVGLSGDGRVMRVDAVRREVETEFGTLHQADVLNVVPPQKAGMIAERAGVTDDSGWVPVNPATFAATMADDIYVVGDATIAAPMPKSGFSASSQGKVAAAAIIAEVAGETPPPAYFTNTCYSLIAPDYGISVAAIYKTDSSGEVEVTSSGLSPAEADRSTRALEAQYARGWYEAIAQDTWGTRY
ncbi:MAG: NAD(P)/FAD-dependent oxidoreductase [Natronospirillum sp.]|uniref:NAD(P)/FAD-dependent oxidoreductase n=1 Tax=Natronospirillum sp. TaxID=2812955 RepID=UPI0025DE75A0|nr:NAD(P)/FAD-dependent oxidoreductase [Natronospirillum sp.]MCH8551214.1 NAD(P)/FAD-dependent oxidoreductase [Natronospirillum sp.]